MAFYVITEACAGNKDASCVEVCPVDCIHPVPGEAEWDEAQQLYIDPDECISCDACVSACPFDAPRNADEVSEGDRAAIELNAAFFSGQKEK